MTARPGEVLLVTGVFLAVGMFLLLLHLGVSPWVVLSAGWGVSFLLALWVFRVLDALRPARFYLELTEVQVEIPVFDEGGLLPAARDHAVEELVALARAGDRAGFDALASCLMPAGEVDAFWAGARLRVAAGPVDSPDAFDPPGPAGPFPDNPALDPAYRASLTALRRYVEPPHP